MRSGSRCPAFYGEIPPMRWGILNDDGGYFYCITYMNAVPAIMRVVQAVDPVGHTSIAKDVVKSFIILLD